VKVMPIAKVGRNRSPCTINLLYSRCEHTSQTDNEARGHSDGSYSFQYSFHVYKLSQRVYDSDVIEILIFFFSFFGPKKPRSAHQ